MICQLFALYCDSFRLLLIYYRDAENISSERITLKQFTAKSVTCFLKWLEDSRNCRISTRNQRLAAIHAFARYCQSEQP